MDLVLNPEFMQSLIESVTYQVSKRVGIELNEEKYFNEFSSIQNEKALLILGSSVNKCSSNILKIVEYKIRQNQNKEENKYEIRKIW